MKTFFTIVGLMGLLYFWSFITAQSFYIWLDWRRGKIKRSSFQLTRIPRAYYKKSFLLGFQMWIGKVALLIVLFMIARLWAH